MWMWKLFVVALEFLLYVVTVSEASGWCTCRFCLHCTGCSATQCSRVGRTLRLLDYLAIYDQEVTRQLQVTSPNIPCTVAINTFCPFPYNNYCCALQSDGTKSCGLGEGWSTCVTGTALVNNVITPTYTKSKCDFDFPCTGNGGNDCCGGLELFNGEGLGTCSPNYCTSSAVQIVACNYVGTSTAQSKTPEFDASVALSGVMPKQVSNKYCGENNISNRNSGRCRASNLCCSPLGLCGETPESCATKSISWSYLSGQWVQTGGATDSSIPCGNGTIGNGRCPTAVDGSDYGTQCCSDSGFCDSSHCNGASGNPYLCTCAHGTPGVGTRGCNTCASCNNGFYLNSSNANTCSPIKIGDFNCPANTFVVNIEFWYDSGSGFITGIDFFKCSDGSIKSVSKGQDTGAVNRRTFPGSNIGYCGGGVAYVYLPIGTYIELTTELTVVSCDGATSSFGKIMAGPSVIGTHVYSFPSGSYLTGLKAATCQNGASNNLCFLTFSSGIVQIAPTAAPTPVPTQTTSAAPTTPAPTACGTIVGCQVDATCACTGCDTGYTYLSTIKKCCKNVSRCNQYSSSTCSCTGCKSPYLLANGKCATTSPPSASPTSAAPTPSPTSKPTAVPSSAPTTKPTLKPSTGAPTTAPTGTCSCPNGVGGAGDAGCTTCQRCNSGYALRPLDFPVVTPYCAPTTVVTCPSGAFITLLQMKYFSTGTLWVDGITSMTCSGGSTIPVNAGGGGANDTPFTATAGDGSSSSTGYCASSVLYDYDGASQLKLTECTGSVDGLFGSNQPTTPISVTRTCGIGERAIGVETTGVKYYNTSGYYLMYFSIVCGPIP